MMTYKHNDMHKSSNSDRQSLPPPSDKVGVKSSPFMCQTRD